MPEQHNAAQLEVLSRIGMTLCIKRDQQELGRGSDINPHHDDVQPWRLEKALRDLSRPGLEHLKFGEEITGSLVYSALNDRAFALWLAWELERIAGQDDYVAHWLQWINNFLDSRAPMTSTTNATWQ